MTHNDKDTELYDKAEELIERKPEFAEGETYGEVTVADLEEPTPPTGDTFNEAEELIEQKPVFGEGETWGALFVSDDARSSDAEPLIATDDTPVFSDDEPDSESVPEDHEHDHPQEHIGLMPLNRINHPLR